MKLWKKSSDEIVDYTLLQKRGILEKSKKIEEQNKIQNSTSAQEFVPYSNIIQTPSSSNTNASSTSPFDMLDNLAQNSSQSLLSSQPSQTQTDFSKEISYLKTKLDDLEYKFERLLEKIDVLENSIKKE